MQRRSILFAGLSAGLRAAGLRAGNAVGLLAVFALAGSAAGQLDLFEEKVRPILAQRCHKCHGTKTQKSGLRLDHVQFARIGGERGPALDASDLGKSRILRAISYGDSHLQMPPKAKLPEAEIEVLRRWILAGASWPDEPLPESKPKMEFDLQGRRAAHWAFRGIIEASPPLVDAPEWRHNPIDRFIYDRLERTGLAAAPLADRNTLLRRVTFDLIGLPPTVAQLDAFLNDARPDAYSRVVDGLLASRHFGERWGRHWLDLVRYSESLGHEFDYDIPNAHRYRDYVIRAFNADVPYDQFVREHLAGDLIDPPRRHPESGFNESILGTGFWWFGSQVHSPVDMRQHQADRTHDQIDVMTKTFVGLTVGCARCHDHKFDAISTADYYALSGFLKSSLYMQRDARASLDAAALADYERTSRKLRRDWVDALRTAATEVRPYLVAAATAQPPQSPVENSTNRETDPHLDPDRLKLWRDALADKAIRRDALHPLRGLVELEELAKKRTTGVDVLEAWQRSSRAARASRTKFAKSNPVKLFDFAADDYSGWRTEGLAFGTGPVREQTMVLGDWLPPAVHEGAWAHSGGRGLHAQGTLHSDSFELSHRYLHVLAHGRESRIKLVVDGFHLIRDPIYGTLKQFVNSTTPRWYTIDLGMWQGRRGCLVLCDQQAPDLGDAQRRNGYRRDGYLAVRCGLLSDDRHPPHPHPHMASTVLGASGTAIRSLGELADSYVRALDQAARALADGTLTAEQSRLLNFMWEKQLLPSSQRIQKQLAAVCESANRVARAMYAPGMAETTGADEHVFVRGGHNNLGPVVPRRFLTALAGDDQPRLGAGGSGRLALAERLLDPQNPFTSRVAVNRLWHHLFGRGLVSTVDNFGVQGRPPSHPELLDWLAHRFVADGWSVKTAVRRMVLSRTYRLASRASAADANDPDLALRHRMPVRRLTGEAIRDAILQISGRLDRKMFGPGIYTKLTRFMTGGRGKPRSGPTDGAGRRSIYIRVRRNFLSPFLLAFDAPIPAGTMGRRTVTNVPAQALAMLNDDFVKEQASLWARRVCKAHPGSGRGVLEDRIRSLYRAASSRQPRPEEQRRIHGFLGSQARVRECSPSDVQPFEDLCHALMNLKEFIFIR